MTSLVSSASAQSNSAVDQYIERVPDAKGGEPADRNGGSGGGSSNRDSGSNGSDSGDDSSSSGSSGSGDDADGKKDKKKDKKDKSKKDDDDSAAAAADGEDDGGGGGAQAATLALERVPAGDQNAGSSGGPLVALLVLSLIGLAGAYGYWRFIYRRRQDGPTPE